MINTVTIKGTIELIKNERQFKDTFMTQFIVSNSSEKHTQHYFISSFSPGTHDHLGLYTLIGKEVELNCYLNGRKGEGDKGTFYTNELRVKELRLL